MIHSMSVATPKRAAPRRCRDDAKALFRNAILESAQEVFAERGFHGARIQDIAARARIAVGTVYNHFTQKEDVLRALLDERTDALLAELDGHPGDPDDFEGKLATRIARVLRYIETHRSFFTVALDNGLIGASSIATTKAPGGNNPRHVAAFRRMFQSLIEEGIASGAL